MGDEVGKQLRSFCASEKMIVRSWKCLSKKIPGENLGHSENQNSLHIFLRAAIKKFLKFFTQKVATHIPALASNSGK